MAWNFYSGFYLVNKILTTITVLVFVFLIFANFYRKRTIGTLLLSISFTVILLAELFYLFSSWFAYYNTFADTTIAMFQVSIPVLYIVAYIYLYFFSNRHILQDSDMIKSAIATTVSIFVGVGLGLMIGDLIAGTGNTFVQNITLAGVDTYIYSPNMILGAIFFAPTLFLVIFRISFKTGKIARSVSKKVTRVGFTLIFWSIINFMFSLLVYTMLTSDSFNHLPAAILVADGMRSIFLFSAMILGYLGWIMPEHLKKRIREKAWLTTKMEQEYVPSSQPIATSSKTNDIAVEITEK